MTSRASSLLLRWLCFASTGVVVSTGCTGGGTPPECEYAVCSAGRCVVDEAGAPECVCGAFDQAAALRCDLLYFDTPELDDNPNNATLLLPPVGPLEAALVPREAPKGDVDYYKVQVEPAHVYRFTLRSDGGMKPVAVVADKTPAEFVPANNPSVVWFESADAGVVLLEVSGSPLGSTGTYTYEVEDLGVDAPGTGTVAPGVSFTGEFLPPGPRMDHYVLEGGPGEIVRIDCDGGVRMSVEAQYGKSWSDVDVLVVEFAAPVAPPLGLSVFSWEQVTHYSCTATSWGLEDYPDTRDQAVALQTFEGAHFTFRTELWQDLDYLSIPLTTDHVYALTCEPSCRVSPSRFEVAGGRSPVLELSGDVGEHTVHVVDLGLDDHGDTPAEATVIVPGRLTRRFETESDRDVFAFDPTPDVIYGWTCPVACAVNWSGDAAAGLVQDQSSSQARIFKVSSPARLTFDDPPRWVEQPETEYPVALDVLGTDDHGDSPQTATPLAVETAAIANLQLHGDVDVFRIHLVPGSYRITAETGSHVLARSLLVDASGQTLPVSGTWQVATEGDYYVRVLQGWGYSTWPAPTVGVPWTLYFRVNPVATSAAR